MKLQKLVKKFQRVRSEKGLVNAIGRVAHYVGNVEGRKLRKQDIQFVKTHKGDVLFINGCCVEHPTRYRVFHQMEQLQQAGVSCAKIYFEDIELEMESNYNSFVFFRCECTEEVSLFIERAKSHNKLVCFDVDDLIVDTKYTDQVPFVNELSPEDRKLFDASVMRVGKTLGLCDVAITTTEALAQELGKVAPRTYINRNTASKEMVLYAEQAYEQHKKEDQKIWLGYFSGSLTHNNDFELIRPALMSVMDRYPEVCLVLVGELDASDELNRFHERIVKKKPTSWKKLPELIVQVDVNLAPLEDTLFNRAKSELKWIEAALVHIPTVASKVGAFEVMIEDGETGILCENTEKAWEEGLCRIIEDERLRKKIGENAYDFVLDNCCTMSKAKNIVKLFKE